MYNRTFRWRFHFNAIHNMAPEKEEGKHAHSFLAILSVESQYMDIEMQNACEKALKTYFNQYNGKYLNELENFKGVIPTIEGICETIYPDTEKIAREYGMEQVQLEVGDSPVALFSMGKRLLLGGMYREVPDELYEEYRERFEWQYL